jgi:hypothetical protein
MVMSKRNTNLYSYFSKKKKTDDAEELLTQSQTTVNIYYFIRY